MVLRASKARRAPTTSSWWVNAHTHTPQNASARLPPSGVNLYSTRTLTRLGVDHIDIYRPARLDPNVPIAWVLSKGSSIVAVIGARKRSQLQESLGALAMQLTPADLAALEVLVAASPIAGTRYDARGMQTLDSER